MVIKLFFARFLNPGKVVKQKIELGNIISPVFSVGFELFQIKIEKVNRLFSQKSHRTNNIVKHIGWSVIFKAASVVITFMLVPLSIKYLGKVNYGIWLTLSSVISWFDLCDIGLGNGLRNKFAEARALGRLNDAQAFVSTAYFTIGAISTMLTFFFIIFNFYTDWTIVFNTPSELKNELFLLIPVIMIFFCLRLTTKLIVSIFLADQYHSIPDRIQFLNQSLLFLLVWLLFISEGNSLLLFGTLFSSVPALVLLGLNLFAFNGRYKEFKPIFSMCKKKYFSQITGIGLKFFVIQIATMILFSTDNFIIAQLFGPAEVVPYNIAFKYFSIVTIGYTILIAPYWSSFTEAYTKQDFSWIRRSVSRIQKIWVMVPIILLLMVLFSNLFYSLWIGNTIKVPIKLSIMMAVFVSLMTFNMAYTNFINGIGVIQIQLITSIISMLINIPLSIFLGYYMGWGTSGVISATCISLSYACIIRPVQYFKLINGTAKGVWVK